MKYYLAPMEGLTTYTFRNAWHKYYGDAEKYFTPFISNRHMNSRERNDILPEHNQGMETVPQILTNRADEFLELAHALADYGYTTVNLNLGCPSGTVVARNRGAGFLGVPGELENFLDEIFEKSPLKISIKTRIGMQNLEEWNRLLSIYEKYPLAELIIHPRLQKEGYGGTPHLEAFAEALSRLSVPLCYNGDIVSEDSLNRVLAFLPGTESVMIGRGILQNPGLMAELRAADDRMLSDSQPDFIAASCLADTSSRTIGKADRLATLRAFHDEILEGYIKIMSGDTNTLYKMKDLWTFLGRSFENSDKHLKKIKKSSRITEYQTAVDALFRECRFRTGHPVESSYSQF